jgi:hypothetical protein
MSTKERPIIFSGEMVCALLEGRKTQTRRVVKVQPEYGISPCHYVMSNWAEDAEDGSCRCSKGEIKCPYGKPGDRLWVRETFERIHRGTAEGNAVPVVVYVADKSERLREEDDKQSPRRYSPIFMPRRLSSILLEVVSVRVERVQSITEADAIAEGLTVADGSLSLGNPWRVVNAKYLIQRYADLWDSINGKKVGCSFADNPFVWVLEFKVLEVTK